MLVDLVKHAGWVAIPLVACSVLALGIILERLFTLARLKQLEDRAFLVLQLSLERGDERALREPQFLEAPVTQVMDSLTELRGASEAAIQQAAELSLALQRLRLRRYLGTLATIGSTAPFVGLFGTVLGIMFAFQGMSQGGPDSSRLMTGISEALSATALGLLVAVPSVVAYNYFLGRVQAMLLQVHGHVARLAPLLERQARERQEA